LARFCAIWQRGKKWAVSRGIRVLCQRRQIPTNGDIRGTLVHATFDATCGGRNAGKCDVSWIERRPEAAGRRWARGASNEATWRAVRGADARAVRAAPSRALVAQDACDAGTALVPRRRNVGRDSPRPMADACPNDADGDVLRAINSFGSDHSQARWRSGCS